MNHESGPDYSKLNGYDNSATVIILGDFNARVQTNSHNWDRVLGRHEVGKLNSNSLLFLSTYAEHNLCTINTIFRFANKYTLSWMYLSSMHWHLHHNTSA